MAGVKTRDFVSASTAAILDPQLRKALERVGTGFPDFFGFTKEGFGSIRSSELDDPDPKHSILPQTRAMGVATREANPACTIGSPRLNSVQK